MASGFMEGFGEAFANSWNTGMQAREQRKNDEFRLTYDQYLKNKDTVAKQKAEDAKNLKLANSVLEGIPNAPKSALANIYNDLQAGMSVEAVNKKYENGEWSEVDPRPNTASQTSQTGSQGPVQAADPKDGAVKVNKGAAPAGTFPTPGLAPRGEGGGMESVKPVDTEMQNSGMAGASPSAPAPAPQEAAPKPEAGGVKFNNLLSGLSGKFNTSTAQGNNAPTRAQQRIAKMTNQTPEQVAQTMQSTHTPQSMPTTAQFKATAVQKADPINNLNEAMIEQAAAQRELAKNDTPDNRRRIEAANDRVNAIQNAVTFAATAKAKAEGLGGNSIPAGVPAAVMNPDGSFMEVAPVAVDNNGNQYNTITGKPIQGRVIPYSEEEMKARRDIFTENQKERDKFNQAAAEVVPMMREVATINDIARQTKGAVLHDGVAGLAQTLTGVQGELQGVSQLLNQEKISFGQIGEAEAQLDGYIQQASQALPQGVTDLAQAKTLYEASRLRLALSLAKANGQGSGRDLSNADLERALAQVSGKDPEALMQVVGNAVGTVLTGLEGQSQIIDQYNSRASQFEQLYGKPSGMTPIRANIEDIIKTSSDPLVARGYQMVSQNRNDPSGAQGMAQRAQTNQGVSSQPMSQPSTPITATGPNGQKIVLQNGQWVPMQ